jgi:hypothetical protein
VLTYIPHYIPPKLLEILFSIFIDLFRFRFYIVFPTRWPVFVIQGCPVNFEYFQLDVTMVTHALIINIIIILKI